MVSIAAFKKLAASYPGADEQPHFEKTSFRVGRKIFATLDATTRLVCVKFSEAEQDVFGAFDKKIIYPVPNKWGKSGWTFINLKLVKTETLRDALTTSYLNVAPKKQADLLRESLQ